MRRIGLSRLEERLLAHQEPLARHMNDHISAKAQAQHLQPHQPHPRAPNQSPTPAGGKIKFNIHAPPFTSAYRKFDDPAKPDSFCSSIDSTAISFSGVDCWKLFSLSIADSTSCFDRGFSRALHSYKITNFAISDPI